MIHDDIGLQADKVEKITHNLSYLYQRATKAVSYCTPAYYADLLCARGRAWLMKAVRRKDSETRFNFSNANNPAMTAHVEYDLFKILPDRPILTFDQHPGFHVLRLTLKHYAIGRREP